MAVSCKISTCSLMIELYKCFFTHIVLFLPPIPREDWKRKQRYVIKNPSID